VALVRRRRAAVVARGAATQGCGSATAAREQQARARDGGAGSEQECATAVQAASKGRANAVAWRLGEEVDVMAQRLLGRMRLGQRRRRIEDEQDLTRTVKKG
jgi:hypothetical protein